MRILIATWNRNLIGGAEKYLQEIIPGLLARGHEVGIVYERRIHPGRETLDSPEHCLSAWGVAEQGFETVMKSVDQWQPEVVYAHGLESSELENSLLRTYPVV